MVPIDENERIIAKGHRPAFEPKTADSLERSF
jgi:hypothetical protein